MSQASPYETMLPKTIVREDGTSLSEPNLFLLSDGTVCLYEVVMLIMMMMRKSTDESQYEDYVKIIRSRHKDHHEGMTVSDMKMVYAEAKSEDRFKEPIANNQEKERDLIENFLSQARKLK